MGRRYFYLLFCILTGMLSSCATGSVAGSEKSMNETSEAELGSGDDCPNKDQSWTFLFYIVADDGSQSFDTSTARYLNTMPTLPENVEALVLLDRCATAYWPIFTTEGQVLETCA